MASKDERYFDWTLFTYQTLLGFDKMPTSWSNQEKLTNNLKTYSQIWLHLYNGILQDVV